MTKPNASASPPSTRATTSASGGGPAISIGPARGSRGHSPERRRAARHGGGQARTLRMGTGSAVPEVVLHGREVGRGLERFSAHRACERRERGLGAFAILRGARGPPEPQEDPRGNAVRARQQVV